MPITSHYGLSVCVVATLFIVYNISDSFVLGTDEIDEASKQLNSDSTQSTADTSSTSTTSKSNSSKKGPTTSFIKKKINDLMNLSDSDLANISKDKLLRLIHAHLKAASIKNNGLTTSEEDEKTSDKGINLATEQLNTRLTSKLTEKEVENSYLREILADLSQRHTDLLAAEWNREEELARDALEESWAEEHEREANKVAVNGMSLGASGLNYIDPSSVAHITSYSTENSGDERVIQVQDESNAVSWSWTLLIVLGSMTLAVVIVVIAILAIYVDHKRDNADNGYELQQGLNVTA